MERLTRRNAAGAWELPPDRLEEAAGSPVTVVATGGSAPRILRYCKRTAHYDADLVMRGLYLLYQKNTRKSRRP